jgi:hypothetical protein
MSLRHYLSVGEDEGESDLNLFVYLQMEFVKIKLLSTLA